VKAIPDYLHRVDVHLSSARNLAIILDHDGEVLLRVFRIPNEDRPSGRWGSPVIRITIGDLMEMAEEAERVHYEFPPLLIRIEGQSVDVFQDPHGRGHRIEGFGGRQLLVRKIEEFLRHPIVQARAVGL
jgi:hypothetical protein